MSEKPLVLLTTSVLTICQMLTAPNYNFNKTVKNPAIRLASGLIYFVHCGFFHSRYSSSFPAESPCSAQILLRLDRRPTSPQRTRRSLHAACIAAHCSTQPHPSSSSRTVQTESKNFKTQGAGVSMLPSCYMQHFVGLVSLFCVFITGGRFKKKGKKTVPTFESNYFNDSYF